MFDVFIAGRVRIPPKSRVSESGESMGAVFQVELPGKAGARLRCYCFSRLPAVVAEIERLTVDQSVMISGDALVNGMRQPDREHIFGMDIYVRELFVPRREACSTQGENEAPADEPNRELVL